MNSCPSILIDSATVCNSIIFSMFLPYLIEIDCKMKNYSIAPIIPFLPYKYYDILS